MTTYLLQQHLRYEYPARISHLRHRLMVVPPASHRDQRRVRHDLEVDGAPASVVTRLDSFGNHVVDAHAPEVPASIEFEVSAVVERDPGAPLLTLPARVLTDHRYTDHSSLTEADEGVAPLAREVHRPGLTPLELAKRINHAVHGAIRYCPRATDVKTTAAHALQLGKGVCQDYAHLMLAVARHCGLPARYVSGHLLGEGGSHAWVEVLVPDPSRRGRALVVPFDPTHDRQADHRYVTVAVGGDYRDVAPTAGTFRAACRGRLTSRKHLRVARECGYEPRVVRPVRRLLVLLSGPPRAGPWRRPEPPSPAWPAWPGPPSRPPPRCGSG